MDFRSFLFVCTSYKASFLNRWDNTWLHLRLHILSPFPPSRDIFPLLNDCTDLTVHTVTCVSASPTRMLTWDRLLEDSPRISSSLPDRVCVCVCVCLPPRGYIFWTFPSLLYTWSVFAIYMGPSSVTFSTRFVFSAHSRVCVPMSLNPRVVTSSGHFDLCYCNTFLLTHLHSLQHPLLLMLSLSLLWSSFSLYLKIMPYIRFCDW